MRTIFPTLVRGGLIMAAALLTTACGGETENAAEPVDSNILFEDLGNDASALEAVGDAGTDVTTDSGADTGANGAAPAGNGTDGGNVFGQTTGGDTGGNTVDRNVSGL